MRSRGSLRRRSFVASVGGLLLAGCTDSGEGADRSTPRPNPLDVEDGDGDGTGDGSTASPTDATNERTATPTPEPTATATPERTPTATEAPARDGPTYTFDGSGGGETDEFRIVGGFTTFDMAHNGESTFRVELIDADSGHVQERLANEDGTWEGLVPYYVPEGDYLLEVTADGDWAVVVRQPRHTSEDAESPPFMGEDEFPNYLGPGEFEGSYRVHGEYEGSSEFVVWLLDADGREEDLLFDETGPFQGETTMNHRGLGYIRVEATGSWLIDVS